MLELESCCIPDEKSPLDLRNVHEVRVKSHVVQVSERDRVDLMLELELSKHGRSVDHDFTYSGREIVVSETDCLMLYLRNQVDLMLDLESSWDGRSSNLRNINSSSQKSCCASESNRSVRVVFAKPSGFDAQIGVFMAWKERGSCLNIFRMSNHGWMPEMLTKYETKLLLRKGVDHVLTYSG
ncbi:uncharacterized protein G2W53_041234 [Senna tora]|uniref:Uncharacterized protein n=1 Tax=Senna tora TaxID=362788 RepID=A0A834SH30_9FABA|nr:uncharacterized protein G2W53_041234 [Senna tora]